MEHIMMWKAVLLALCLTTIAIRSENIQDANKERKNIFIFGGNGFIGSEVVTQLLEKNGSYNIITVSRGNWPFDSLLRIKPHVLHIPCDRYPVQEEESLKSSLLDCKELKELVDKTELFDYVIDFSAYKPEMIRDALALLEGKIGVYIYISSDSVYEVSSKNNTGPSQETFAVRPDSFSEREELAKEDSYGDKKMSGEEVLKESRLRGGPPYVILRLPDVFGPRDSTRRWWFYILWVEFYHVIDVPIFVPPKIQNLETSYVYVKDVGQAVLRIIEKGQEVWDQEYNIAFDRIFTLSNTLLQISTALQIKDVEADYHDYKNSFHLIPSVTRGPVDISKAKVMLDFQPTPWEEAFKDTLKFYERAFFLFPVERSSIVDDLLLYVVPSDKQELFLDAIEAKLANKGSDRRSSSDDNDDDRRDEL